MTSLKIEVCKGQAGLALYVDDTRVAGPRHNGAMETILSAVIPAQPAYAAEPVAWRLVNDHGDTIAWYSTEASASSEKETYWPHSQVEPLYAISKAQVQS